MGSFHVINRVSIGPRGGINGMVLLINQTITPATDALRVGVLDIHSSHPFLKLNSIFKSDKPQFINDETIIESLTSLLVSLPEEEEYYVDFFKNGAFETPNGSRTGLQGGAPGLGK